MLINMLYFIYFILESIQVRVVRWSITDVSVIYFWLLTICQYLNAQIVTPMTNEPSVK